MKDKVHRGNMVGERKSLDLADEHVSSLLNNHLDELITGDTSKFTWEAPTQPQKMQKLIIFDDFSVQEILEVSRQTVAGISYKIRGHFMVEGEDKDCTVTILERPWHETEKINISAKCADGTCYVPKTYTCPPRPL
jgi:hypothetical protein